MPSFKKTYAGLKELIIRDQFFCKCADETRCFIKQKGKLDLEDMLIQAQYFIESKDSMERKWLPGQRKDKSNSKDFGKVVERTNTLKPKEKSSEQKETRSFQPRGAYQNSWYERNQNSNPNKAQPRKGCYASLPRSAWKAARLVGGLSKFSSITAYMRDVLHWLPISERIQYRITAMVSRCVLGCAPS